MSEVRILQGDCRDVLKTLPDESVHMCCTSPPYFGLRDYGTATWEGGEELYKCNQCAKMWYAKDLPDLPQESSQTESTNVQPIVRDEIGNQANRSNWQEVENPRTGSQVGRQRSTETMGSEQHELEGRRETNKRRIHHADNAFRTSKGHEAPLHDGASLGDGEETRSLFGGVGDSSPQERNQGRQPNREFGTSDEENPQGQGAVPSLRERICDSLKCPQCSGLLVPTGCDHLPDRSSGIASSTLDGGKATTNHQQEGWKGKDCGKCGAKRIDSQLGLEQTPDAYVAELVAVFREVRRVLRGDGVLFVNLGDSYFGSSQTGGTNSISGNGKSQPHCLKPTGLKPTGLKPKDLLGIPWMVAFALRADGWYLRSDIIWHKPNPMPESIKDRPTKAHEYLFLLSKSAKYWYDADAIAEPANPEYASRYDYDFSGSKNGQDAAMPNGYSIHPKGAREFSGTRNRRTVWTVPTCGYTEAHFATFPPDLIKPCILAGCPKFTCGSCGTALDSYYEKHRSNTEGETIQDMQMVRDEGGTGSQKPSAELLQQGLCFQMDSKEPEHDERIYDHNQGVPPDSETRSPECDSIRLHDGTSSGHGGSTGTIFTTDRSSSSQRREPLEQRAGEFGSANENRARQASKTQNRNDSLPPLQRKNTTLSICPRCGAALDEVGIKPGIVLDCFGGSGTTGMVARELGRNAILIELNPDYLPLIEARINVTPGLPL